MARLVRPLMDRFDAKWMPEPNTGCWLWTGATNDGASRYGKFMVESHGHAQRIVDFAHRVSWRLHRGEIPDGMCVCHHCDTPACVNPDHLFLGTYADNTADMHAKGRASGGSMPGESHPNHKLTEEIVRVILESTEPARVLDRRFGVSGGTCGLIRRGRSWKHIYREVVGHG